MLSPAEVVPMARVERRWAAFNILITAVGIVALVLGATFSLAIVVGIPLGACLHSWIERYRTLDAIVAESKRFN